MKTNPTIIAARERKEHKSEKVSVRSLRSFAAIVISFLFTGTAAQAQVNSGSNGSDGAFHPTTNIVINMADHPDGIYHYTSVNIPSGVTVTFIPNANNTPVVWLVQSNVYINGAVNVSGQNIGAAFGGGVGGPGGYPGGAGGSNPRAGQGPGGSPVGYSGSYATKGTSGDGAPAQGAAPIYGNVYLLPFVGGSGGGGHPTISGGGGGGGAILIAASGVIRLDGSVNAGGGGGGYTDGSGGSVRIIATTIAGGGSINAHGYNYGGLGRVRFDTYANNFSGSVDAVFTQGYQPIIIPTNGQGAQLTITSVGGVPVSASPSGQLATPDAVLSAQQNNPIPIVVQCSNIPLNTQITVSVKPANGPAVSATGLNSSGTLSSSTATVLINMPRGGGLIYATAATGN